jgi:UDP-N-acetylglucosamine:LPS N-acetylglucosamine transferase
MKMPNTHILFISWQGAMGHVTRDLAIVKELHRIAPDVDVSWVAHPLGAKLIQEAGEKLLPESGQVGDYNLVAVQAVEKFGLNLMKYIRMYQEPSRNNARLVNRLLQEYDFDLIVGDEIYETLVAFAEGKIQLNCPVIMIEDFIGIQAMDKNLIMRMGAYLKNRKLVKATEKTSSTITHLFVGELEDVADRRYDFFLPNCRDFAREYYRFLGHIARFDPAKYRDKAKIRAKLGYGNEPLVICATGGTGIGRELLELCGKAYPLLKKEISDLHMVCVCGELLGLDPPKLSAEVELHGFIPDIYEHYAACDLAVVIGGGTTTIELTALRKPFIFFPLEDQFDQQINVSERIARHKAGVRMEYRHTTPEMLAQVILKNIGRKMEAKSIPFDGAKKAAEIISELLRGNR